ncbi:hypothetical protein HDU85_005919 [Gaertneriomyces sp. JEL0708]|nr:hypothetical protein HDU85_005919 [Gaertneriomyces sp. JEL0708]
MASHTSLCILWLLVALMSISPVQPLSRIYRQIYLMLPEVAIQRGLRSGSEDYVWDHTHIDDLGYLPRRVVCKDGNVWMLSDDGNILHTNVPDIGEASTWATSLQHSEELAIYDGSLLSMSAGTLSVCPEPCKDEWIVVNNLPTDIKHMSVLNGTLWLLDTTGGVWRSDGCADVIGGTCGYRITSTHEGGIKKIYPMSDSDILAITDSHDLLRWTEDKWTRAWDQKVHDVIISEHYLFLMEISRIVRVHLPLYQQLSDGATTDDVAHVDYPICNDEHHAIVRYDTSKSELAYIIRGVGFNALYRYLFSDLYRRKLCHKMHNLKVEDMLFTLEVIKSEKDGYKPGMIFMECSVGIKYHELQNMVNFAVKKAKKLEHEIRELKKQQKSMVVKYPDDKSPKFDIRITLSDAK